VSLNHKLSNIWRQDMSAHEQSECRGGREAADALQAGGPRRRGRLLWPQGRQLVEIVGAVHLCFVRIPGPRRRLWCFGAGGGVGGGRWPPRRFWHLVALGLLRLLLVAQLAPTVAILDAVRHLAVLHWNIAAHLGHEFS